MSSPPPTPSFTPPHPPILSQLLRKSSSNLALSQKVYQDAAHGLLALDSHQKAADVYMRYGATLVETGQVILHLTLYAS